MSACRGLDGVGGLFVPDLDRMNGSPRIGAFALSHRAREAIGFDDDYGQLAGSISPLPLSRVAPGADGEREGKQAGGTGP